MKEFDFVKEDGWILEGPSSDGAWRMTSWKSYKKDLKTQFSLITPHPKAHPFYIIADLLP
jgi:hypothetical protein